MRHMLKNKHFTGIFVMPLCLLGLSSVEVLAGSSDVEKATQRELESVAEYFRAIRKSGAKTSSELKRLKEEIVTPKQLETGKTISAWMDERLKEWGVQSYSEAEYRKKFGIDPLDKSVEVNENEGADIAAEVLSGKNDEEDEDRDSDFRRPASQVILSDEGGEAKVTLRNSSSRGRGDQPKVVIPNQGPDEIHFGSPKSR